MCVLSFVVVVVAGMCGVIVVAISMCIDSVVSHVVVGAALVWHAFTVVSNTDGFVMVGDVYT